MKLVPLTLQSTSPALAIEDNMRAYAFGDEAVVIFCEVTNTTDHIVESGRVQAAGYDGRGWITDLAEAGPWCFLPRQTLAVRISLRPLGERVTTACLFTSCEPSEFASQVAV